MLTNFLKSFSDTQLLVAIPAAACMLLWITAVIFRRFQRHLRLVQYDGDILDTATQNTMSGAYVVLGFVLVLAMTTVSDLDSAVSKEATSIKSLERLLVLDGSPNAMRTRELLVGYTSSLIRDEWPVLKDGRGSPVTSDALQELFLSLDQLAPTSTKAAVLYSKVIEQADRVAELRNSRILSVQSNLPGIFYTVSLLSVMGVIIIAALRLIESTPIRALALVTQLIMLTLMFGAIVILDLPYLGDTVSSPDALQTALQSIIDRKIYH